MKLKCEKNWTEWLLLEMDVTKEDLKDIIDNHDGDVRGWAWENDKYDDMVEVDDTQSDDDEQYWIEDDNGNKIEIN